MDYLEKPAARDFKEDLFCNVSVWFRMQFPTPNHQLLPPTCLISKRLEQIHVPLRLGPADSGISDRTTGFLLILGLLPC